MEWEYLGMEALWADVRRNPVRYQHIGNRGSVDCRQIDMLAAGRNWTEKRKPFGLMVRNSDSNKDSLVLCICPASDSHMNSAVLQSQHFFLPMASLASCPLKSVPTYQSRLWCLRQIRIWRLLLVELTGKQQDSFFCEHIFKQPGVR
ncbi:hypothetical protein KIL84_021269 [Mauremys mutica]|uniref:Uncharacterized protein n=1 Tax=Mauremys mutica TaxID=74926 RepID=A0A9D4B1C1_9SAUR|nr:hypothetical protein KIL84_021269 [Mauremys mutica]